MPTSCRISTTPVDKDAAAQPNMHPLGEEPPAKVYSAVYREIDQCPSPIVLRQEVGAPKPRR